MRTDIRGHGTDTGTATPSASVHPMGYPACAHALSRLGRVLALDTVDERCTNTHTADVERANERMRKVKVSVSVRTRNMYTANSEQRTARAVWNPKVQGRPIASSNKPRVDIRIPDPLCGGGGGARVLTFLRPPSFLER